MRVSLPKIAVVAGAIGVLGLGAGMALGAPPAKTERQARTCFLSRDVVNFAAPDEHTLYLRAHIHDVYKVDVFGGCQDIDWSLRIGIKTYGGGDWLCVGDQAELIVPNRGIGPQRCPVKILSKLTPEEIAALPKKARP
jgi:hypothetical protein